MKRPRISMIWAMDKNGLIGKDNDLPWRLPNDWAYFKQTTMGKPVVMGRKTLESLPNPLPGRTSYIITRNKDFQAEGVKVVHSLDEALEQIQGDELFILGGAKIYELALPLADRLYITHIHHAFEGDTYFPSYDTSEWRLIASTEGKTDDKNRYAHTFAVYERKFKKQAGDDDDSR